MWLPAALERQLSAVLKWGLFLLLPLPLYISSSMLFPFITGRNFGFRILVELLVIGWVGLLVLSREFRPQLSWLTKSVLVLLFVVTVADILGANPYRSFWSNYERMEGLLALIHMTLFYLMTSTLFRSWKDWRLYLLGSTVISLVVSGIALSQKLGLTKVYQGGEGASIRVDGTIGNAAYLASYLAFHVFFLLFYMWREKISWLRWVMGVAALCELYIIYLTATRGVILAMIAVAGIFTVVFALRRPADEREKLLRRASVGVLAVCVVAVGIFFLMRDTDFVKKNSILVRFSTISIGERTVQSRFLIWKMAGEGIQERPILGWGQENFYLIFNKYYNPKLWGSEPWFDRSHNVFLDWMVHAGILGLAAYLLVLYFGVRNIWIAYRNRRLSPYESGILGGMFLVYFFQNFFVFDNFQSYFLLFLTLAFSNFLAHPQEGPPEPDGRSRQTRAVFFWGTTGCAVVVVIAALYFINIRPIRASEELIQTLSAASQNAPISEIQKDFQSVIDYGTFGSGEAREQIASMARGLLGTSGRGTPDEVKKFAEFAVAEVKNLSTGPAPDAKHLLFLGSMYNTAASLDPSFLSAGEAALREALRLSPTKQPIYFELANSRLQQGDGVGALGTMQKAVELDPSFPNAHLNMAIVAASVSNKEIAIRELATFRQLQTVSSGDIFERVLQIYVKMNDFKDIKSLIEEAIRLTPKEATLYGRYAATLATLGDKVGAKAAAIKAGELNPQLQPAVDAFLKELEAGKTP